MINTMKSFDGEWTTIRITGRFDFSCHREFNECHRGTPTRGYVVDLTAATYVDSAALGMLLMLREKVGNECDRVRLVGCTGQPAEVLRVAQFGRLFAMS
jgi:anti-anti-sigma factor